MADTNLDNLTDEQILALIRKAEKGEESGGKKQERVKVQLGNGEVIEADSPEALNQILAARLSEHRETETIDPEPTNPQGTQALPKKFDYKKFEKTFVEDPVAGLDYADEVRFGAPLKQVLPQLGMLVGTLAKKVQELETQQFLDTTPDYEPTVQNRKAIEQVMSERGWQPSRQTLEDAFAIASAKGLIKSSESKGRKSEPESEQFIPPRTKGSFEQRQPDDELRAAIDGASDEKIFEWAKQFGIVSR